MKLEQIKFQLSALIMFPLIFASLTSCDTNLELVQSVDTEFTDISVLEIDAGFLDVSYQGDENLDLVELVGSLESNRPGRFQIEYREEQGKLIIELKSSGGGSTNSRGEISLKGPARMEIDFKSGSGNSQIHNLILNKFDFDGGSGNLELTNISAEIIDLELGSGNIKASNLTGDLALKISSGNASVSNLKGNIDAVGSSGKFTFSNIDGKVNSSLNSGNISLNGIRELGKLKVSSGNCTVESSYLGAKTILESSSGNMSIRTNSNLDDFNFDLKTSSGNLRVGESTSSGSLKIDNGSPYTVSGVVSSGNIQIRN
ncbi:DUF4097 family beta strand repeat-containing protein [Algoriphagus aquimarinus]|uniref:DUF4097 family beta strand repeat-containing protein n=1 Tax=Algoriphagus aquimarinus TaxID=237018 RepID=UPI0030DA80B1|tara:strand:+ start:142905 stop:143849 length:945 start_codon:yes stop_codon:yes gene_type:complete